MHGHRRNSTASSTLASAASSSSRQKVFNRTLVPATHVLEDFCEGGRAGGGQAATEVVVIPEWRLIYVDNKKAGSTTINLALQRHFNSSGFFCDGVIRRDADQAARLSWCTV